MNVRTPTAGRVPRLRRLRLAAAAIAVGWAFVGAAAAKDAPETKKAPEAILWRRTYAEALLEARLRNVPVLVTRHKDG